MNTQHAERKQAHGNQRVRRERKKELSLFGMQIILGKPIEDTGSTATYGKMTSLADFFSPEIFHIVLHDPTTAHRFLRFCQSRACGENMKFLQSILAFKALLDDMTTALSTINAEFIAPGAVNELNLPSQVAKEASSELKEATISTLPWLGSIFREAQRHIEDLVADDIYPRFVKHQITTSATMAIALNREQFNGLGDCFCMTDPHIPDNPIVFASDGFVSVTGYSREDIIFRNCRFLQGKQTDRKAIKRLCMSVERHEETVELLLNYRKNGEPFWNLVYCAPLFNDTGDVALFLGGQIDCSTTINSCADLLKILSVNDDELDQQDSDRLSQRSGSSHGEVKTPVEQKSAFFKSWGKWSTSSKKIPSGSLQVRTEVGMKRELLDRVGNLNFKTQVEAFYTAYSKYLVLHYDPDEQLLLVQHFSTGIIDLLCLNLSYGPVASIHNNEIFNLLVENSPTPSSSSMSKLLKSTILTALEAGRALSVEIGLMTELAERKSGGESFGGNGAGVGWERDESFRKVEVKYVTHWTPLRDEHDSVKKVVLIIVPKI